MVLPVAAPLALPEVAVELPADDPVEAEAAALEEPLAVDEAEAGELVAAVDAVDVGDAVVVDDAADVVAAEEAVAAEVVEAAVDDGEVVAADVAAVTVPVAEPALLEAALPLLPQPESAMIRTSDVKYRRRRSTGLLLCDPRSAEKHPGKKHAKRSLYSMDGGRITSGTAGRWRSNPPGRGPSAPQRRPSAPVRRRVAQPAAQPRSSAPSASASNRYTGAMRRRAT